MIIKKLKQIKKSYTSKRSICEAFRNDCNTYVKWQYHNPQIKSKNAMEAKILRHTHVLEKGMSLSHPRSGFGVQRASELLDFIDEYVSEGYESDESSAVLNALGVLKAYIDFHRQRNFQPEEIIKRLQKWESYIPAQEEYGIKTISYDDLKIGIHGEFPDFFNSRHAIRQFAEEPITIEEIKRAVALAMRAPSACNRQSCKVYFYTDPDINATIGNNIPGNTGFADEIKNYLVVTSDISAFYDSFERNQVYVDGGIFVLALAESLHYYGIGSCILQNGETKERDHNIRAVCTNIPKNEKIIVFLAIGHYKKEFTYAVSHRKNIEDVLIIK